MSNLKGRLIIVDDEADLIEVLTDGLSDLMPKEEIITFTDSLEALRFIRHKAHSLDTLLTDFNMPGPDGNTLARAAKIKGMPSILCSGRAEGSDYPIFKLSISKPFEEKDLRCVVKIWKENCSVEGCAK